MCLRRQKPCKTTVLTLPGFIRQMDESIKTCMEHIDYFMPSYEEAAAFRKEKPEEMAKSFFNGSKNVAIKLGKKAAI